jgi:hypothetical protein
MPFAIPHPDKIFGVPLAARLRRRILTALSGVLLSSVPGGAWAQVAVLTQHNDNGRTGANTKESALAPYNVNLSQFGKLFTYTLNDQTYSQPLYVPHLTMSVDGQMHNVVFVTTVSNSVYAWDADRNTANGGLPLWQKNLTPSGARPPNIQDMSNMGACWYNYHDFAGNIGIVGTPVIDAGNNVIYLVARTVEGGAFVQRLHALDIRSGNEILGGPVVISGSYDGVVFSSSGSPSPAQLQNQRSALTLVNGVLYIAWSSHCDYGKFHGWVMGYNAGNLSQITAWNDSPTGSMAGIWQGGQGATVDGAGNLYFMTGNGSWDGRFNFGESALQLTPSASGALSVGKYFTPWNYLQLNNGDTDLGSAGVVLIPGTRLVAGAGKQGMLYVMDTDVMGGITTGAPDNVVQEFQATFIQNGGSTLHIHGGPVFFTAPSAQYLYLWGENDRLRAYQYSNPAGAFPEGGGGPLPSGPLFNSTAVAQSTMLVPQVGSGMPGGFLSTSSNGTANGIVWALTPHACDANQHVEPGALFAFDAANFVGSGATRTLVELWDSTQVLPRDDVGYFAKFTNPTIASGKVYVGSWGSVPAANESKCAETSSPAAPSNKGQLVVYGFLASPSGLSPGSSIPVPALTDKGDPNLDGVVQYDQLVPFTLQDSNGLQCTGNLEERVVTSNNTGDLDFYYRVRDTAGSGSVAKVSVSSFAGLWVGVGYRTDDLGTVPPTTADLSAAPGASITFDFSSHPISCAAQEESQFILISTAVTSFQSGGQADIFSTGGIDFSMPSVMP